MKKLILFFTILISTITYSQKIEGPEFEIYSGILDSKYSSQLGYVVGLNLTPDLFQLNKHNPKVYRKYLNKLLVGFEFSGYQDKTINTIITDPSSSETINICNCDINKIGNTDGSEITNIINKDVKGLGVNFGIEIYKGWFITSGITSYKYEYTLNDETISSSRTTFVDAGVKKFIKIGPSYISPGISFNSEVVSFTLGYSYYKH